MSSSSSSSISSSSSSSFHISNKIVMYSHLAHDIEIFKLIIKYHSDQLHVYFFNSLFNRNIAELQKYSNLNLYIDCTIIKYEKLKIPQKSTTSLFYRINTNSFHTKSIGLFIARQKASDFGCLTTLIIFIIIIVIVLIFVNSFLSAY